MGIDNLTTRRLSASIRKTEARELCLYRLSVWCSMGDDGSPRYNIRDQIDPVFAKNDPVARKRADHSFPKMDILVTKYDSSGQDTWSTKIDSGKDDYATAIIETSDGG